VSTKTIHGPRSAPCGRAVPPPAAGTTSAAPAGVRAALLVAVAHRVVLVDRSAGRRRREGAMSRDSLWQRLTRGAQRFWHRPDWPRFAGNDWADRIMEVAVTDRFHAKQGRSTGRLVLGGPGRELTVYLKRHYRLPRWRGL